MRTPLMSLARTLAVVPAMLLVACRHAPRHDRDVISVDGSSTVYPLAEAIAEDFTRASPGTHVTIGVAGTSGGLRRLCRGVLDLAAASRPIAASEATSCAAAGIGFVELPVAFDGITVAVHPSNTWVESLTVEDLRRLWRHEAEGTLLHWSQLRPTYPAREVHLFGAGVDSGTFDYFTGAITGAPRDSRGDYTSSEDDNTLVQGVAGDPNALGYFGFAYYEAHQEYVRAVAIRADASTDAVLPTRDTIRSGAYRPLARPVFIYVNVHSLERVGVRRFVDYFITHVTEVANDIGYVPLETRLERAVRARLEARRTGSVFADDAGPQPLTLAARLGVE